MVTVRCPFYSRQAWKPNLCASAGVRVPTVHREAGYVFYFYAEEGIEPPHVHVDKGDGTAKL